MRHATLLPSALLLALFALFSIGAQRPPEPSAPASSTSPSALAIRGVGLQQTSFSAADLAAMPRRTISVKDKDEAEVK